MALPRPPSRRVEPLAALCRNVRISLLVEIEYAELSMTKRFDTPGRSADRSWRHKVVLAKG